MLALRLLSVAARRQMAHISRSPWLGAVFCLGVLECAAGEIKLDSGATLTVSDTQYSRTLPHVFYDRAGDSVFSAKLGKLPSNLGVQRAPASGRR